MLPSECKNGMNPSGQPWLSPLWGLSSVFGFEQTYSRWSSQFTSFQRPFCGNIMTQFSGFPLAPPWFGSPEAQLVKVTGELSTHPYECSTSWSWRPIQSPDSAYDKDYNFISKINFIFWLHRLSINERFWWIEVFDKSTYSMNQSFRWIDIFNKRPFGEFIFRLIDFWSIWIR